MPINPQTVKLIQTLGDNVVKYKSGPIKNYKYPVMRNPK